MNIEVDFEFKRGDVVALRGDVAGHQYGHIVAPPRAMTVLARIVEVGDAGEPILILYVVSYMPEYGADSSRSMRLQLHACELVAYPEPKGGK